MIDYNVEIIYKKGIPTDYIFMGKSGKFTKKKNYYTSDPNNENAVQLIHDMSNHLGIFFYKTPYMPSIKRTGILNFTMKGHDGFTGKIIVDCRNVETIEYD